LERLAERGEGLGEGGRREDRERLVPGRRAAVLDLAASRREHGRQGRRREHPLHHGPPPDQPGSARSTTTLVDFTPASATTPARSPRSSAASRLISDTTRNGPAWISTCAITPSRTTSVTMPRSRLRAEENRTPWSSGAPPRACSRTKAASSAPGTRRCPCSSRDAGSRPPSTQRRTVSALTPSSAAASLIRKVVTEPTLLCRRCMVQTAPTLVYANRFGTSSLQMRVFAEAARLRRLSRPCGEVRSGY